MKLFKLEKNCKWPEASEQASNQPTNGQNQRMDTIVTRSLRPNETARLKVITLLIELFIMERLSCGRSFKPGAQASENFFFFMDYPGTFTVDHSHTKLWSSSQQLTATNPPPPPAPSSRKTIAKENLTRHSKPVVRDIYAIVNLTVKTFLRSPHDVAWEGEGKS